MIHLSFGNIPGADLKMFQNALKINNWSLCIKIFSGCFFFSASLMCLACFYLSKSCFVIFLEAIFLCEVARPLSKRLSVQYR